MPTPGSRIPDDGDPGGGGRGPARVRRPRGPVRPVHRRGHRRPATGTAGGAGHRAPPRGARRGSCPAASCGLPGCPGGTTGARGSGTSPGGHRRPAVAGRVDAKNHRVRHSPSGRGSCGVLFDAIRTEAPDSALPAAATAFPNATLRIHVGPLDMDAADTVIRRELGLSLRRPALAWIMPSPAATRSIAWRSRGRSSGAAPMRVWRGSPHPWGRTAWSGLASVRFQKRAAGRWQRLQR